MRPTEGTKVFRPDLGSQVIEAHTNEQSYIATQIMPVYYTDEKSGTYKVIPHEAFSSLENVERAPGSAYNRSGWTYEEGLYSTREKGHEQVVDDSERKQLDKRMPGATDRIAIKRGLNIINKSQESRVANLLFNENNFTKNDVAIKWTEKSTSKPLDDVLSGVSSFREKSGFLPDTLVITWGTFNSLRANEQIIDKIKYTFPGIDIQSMSSDQLAHLFGIRRVLVANALYNKADKGQPSELTDIWNKQFSTLLKTSNSYDISEPCIGRTFIWDSDSSEEPIVEVYREEQSRGDVYRIRHTVDERLIKSYKDNGDVMTDVAAKCCYLFGNVG